MYPCCAGQGQAHDDTQLFLLSSKVWGILHVFHLGSAISFWITSTVWAIAAREIISSVSTAHRACRTKCVVLQVKFVHPFLCLCRFTTRWVTLMTREPMLPVQPTVLHSRMHTYARDTTPLINLRSDSVYAKTPIQTHRSFYVPIYCMLSGTEHERAHVPCDWAQGRMYTRVLHTRYTRVIITQHPWLIWGWRTLGNTEFHSPRYGKMWAYCSCFVMVYLLLVEWHSARSLFSSFLSSTLMRWHVQFATDCEFFGWIARCRPSWLF